MDEGYDMQPQNASMANQRHFAQQKHITKKFKYTQNVVINMKQRSKYLMKNHK